MKLKLILFLLFFDQISKLFPQREIPFWLLRTHVLCLKFKTLTWRRQRPTSSIRSPFISFWQTTSVLTFDIWHSYSRCHIASTDTTNWVDDLDSRFLFLTNAIHYFCCLIQSNTVFDYKATFCKSEMSKLISDFIFQNSDHDKGGPKKQLSQISYPKVII